MTTAHELDASQQLAVDLMLHAPVGIITGGPGTGKTTTLRTALDALDALGVTYALCAPTGKAAKRITEAVNAGRDPNAQPPRKASTIHRLLESHPAFGFRRNADAPIAAGVVFVDESSMVDIELGAALFDAIRAGRTRVILIGDANQLPPVGPGCVFSDLISSGLIPVARLTTLHRAARESWVARNAPRVLVGGPLELDTQPGFRLVRAAAGADVLGAVQRVVTEHRDSDRQFQVLLPQRQGAAGVDECNGALQRLINPRKSPDELHVRREQYEIRVGDRVIQTRNDYEREIFNGEIGDVLAMDTGGIVVQFDEREVAYTLEAAQALQLAYALTIHRSQGSEFDHVITVVHSTHTFMLSRRLVYTAITRARLGVTIVGDDKGLAHALGNERVAKRNTTLIERLRGELDDVIDDTDADATGGAP